MANTKTKSPKAVVGKSVVESLSETKPRRTLGMMIDEYGRLRAQASDLKKQLDDLKGVLRERIGEGNSKEGELFRVTVTDPFNVDYLDEKMIREEMSPAWLRKYTKTRQQVNVNCSARKGQ